MSFVILSFYHISLWGTRTCKYAHTLANVVVVQITCDMMNLDSQPRVEITQAGDKRTKEDT